jgi:hypothetical protein
MNILAHGPASGGYCLYASGNPGTVSIDNFRVTQFPDPSLALEPVGRAGSSYVGWNSFLPSDLTTLGIDVSKRGDGTDWTDVTGQNGGSIPMIYSQPPPTIDGYAIDSSGDYTSTSANLGAAGTWVIDTANSRLVGTGGTKAIYLYNNIARADVDVLVHMDQSDAGGIVFRFVDSSNYYRLVVADASASVGTPNRLSLYEVVADVETLLSQGTISFVRGTYHAVRVSMLDGLITVSFDGAVLFSYTDTTPLGAGNIGLFNNGGATGSRYYMLWIQPQGDKLLNTYIYTKQRFATADPNNTGQLLDLETSVKNSNITNGVLVPQLHQTSKPIAEYIDKEIKTLSDLSDTWSTIDDDKNLIFKQRQASPAPWPVSQTDLLALTVKPSYAADAYRNQQTILGVVDTILIINEKKVADGTATSWSLGYRVAAAPVITISNTNKSIGMQGIDTNKDFYWTLDSNSVSQDSNAPVLANGTIMNFTYLGNYDTSVTVPNQAEITARASIETGTSGIVEAYETVDGINKAAALVYAQGLLTRFAKTYISLSGQTKRPGLVPGQLANFFIVAYPNMFDRQLLITKVTIVPAIENDNTVYYYDFEASDGPNLGAWSRLFD